MKNQYVGDINDFKKYGLLRAIIQATDWQTCVAWMLTRDDGSTDGTKTDYLQRASKYSVYDQALFDQLTEIVRNPALRSTAGIEHSGLLPKTRYFSDLVPEQRSHRNQWFADLLDAHKSSDLVFLDPDNGIEVKSKPYGSKDSNKYAFWHELKTLWGHDCSLFVYQHFPRRERKAYMAEMIKRLNSELPGSTVTAFRTANVVFFLATQGGKEEAHFAARRKVNSRWYPLVSEFRVISA